MSSIGCTEFLNRVDDWLDGQQDADFRAHLSQCSDCRSLVEDIGAIQDVGRSLAAGAETEPSPRVWTSLRAQLEGEGLIHSTPAGWLANLRAWLEGIAEVTPRPALAGAYLALLIALAFAVGRPNDSRINASSWARNTADFTGVLSAQLNTAERDAISSVRGPDALVMASLHENLAIIDNHISLCENSVREEPENEAARDYLYEAYQQKAELLAQISERGER
jgi:hypothetical protein